MTKVYEVLTDPAKPLPLGRPDDYQSFGIQGLIHPMGSPYIYGKDVPLGSRIKITTKVEIVPPTPEDLQFVLSKWLPPVDAPVHFIDYSAVGFYHCRLCEKKMERGDGYYNFGGFNGHKTCVDERRAKYAIPARDAETTTIR